MRRTRLARCMRDSPFAAYRLLTKLGTLPRNSQMYMGGRHPLLSYSRPGSSRKNRLFFVAGTIRLSRASSLAYPDSRPGIIEFASAANLRAGGAKAMANSHKIPRRSLGLLLAALLLTVGW